jgi:hypothetical protein
LLNMRAARYYGKEDMRVEEIEEPVCGDNQVKIRPAFVGICGTGIFSQFLNCPANSHTDLGLTQIFTNTWADPTLCPQHHTP